MKSRRSVLVSGMAVAGVGLIRPAMGLGFLRTPEQAEGPFYPDLLPKEHDTDLTHVDGHPERAKGTPLDLVGRVKTSDGGLVIGAQIDLWQCDANGAYHHRRDRGGNWDLGFQGFGRTISDANGAYRFRTIRPVPYPGRTPHIHFKVKARGFPVLTTQMYVLGEPGNGRDFLYRRLKGAAAREAVTVQLVETEDGYKGTFDLVIG
ncbi:MAG: hypothetical protein ACPGOV_06670 [Magnetovibrionaceae bacterium]